ncbi:MAG: NACHT domain-containing protein, partial [Anaerolineales bacterium]|nr:NACHT domain-containing protein [Anaerolineales bacterium]
MTDTTDRSNKIQVNDIHSEGGDVTLQKFVSNPDPNIEAAKRARDRYLHRLARACNILPLDVFELGSHKHKMQLDDVYIDLHVMNRPVDEESKQMERHAFDDARRAKAVTVHEVMAREKHLVLLGEAGSGKSSALASLALRLASAHLGQTALEPWHRNSIPLLIRLRDMAPYVRFASAKDKLTKDDRQVLRQAFWTHLERQLADYEAAEYEVLLKDALVGGDVVLLLDGLDEMAANNRQAVRWFVDVLLESYPFQQVIISCRTRSFDNHLFEGFDQATVAPLTEAQIRGFVTAWYETQKGRGFSGAEVKERIADFQQALNDPDMLKLADTPILLTQMAVAHQKDTTLPNQRVMLYDKVVDLLMQRWGLFRGLTIPGELEEKLRDKRIMRLILERIAYMAHDRQASGQSKEGDLTAKELIELLETRQMLDSRHLAVEMLDFVDQRAAILVGRGGGERQSRFPQRYGFPHRTFQEYLAGCHLMSGGDRSRLRKVRQRAAEGNFWQMALELGSEEIYHVKRSFESLLLPLAYELVPESGFPSSEAGWRAVLWSGLMARLVGTAELARQAEGEDGDPTYLDRLRHQLSALMAQ